MQDQSKTAGSGRAIQAAADRIGDRVPDRKSKTTEASRPPHFTGPAPKSVEDALLMASGKRRMKERDGKVKGDGKHRRTEDRTPI